ncbi:hypothetical protein IKG20_00830 [Candidatus Saccharibacteria bacterium]|nr:hypothetical protein [Candidatus Saccharibacteria bacterium]
MVYRPTQPGEVEERKQSRVVQILIDILTLVLVAGATYAFFRLTLIRPENQEVNNPEVVNKAPAIEDEETEEDEEEKVETLNEEGALESNDDEKENVIETTTEDKEE